MQPLNSVMVFGSNEGGRHGKGAALDALMLYGAIYGQALGLQGKSFAIPTKMNIKDLSDPRARLTPAQIRQYVYALESCAYERPDLNFLVTRIGCGHSKYSNAEMAPLFRECPIKNVFFDIDWLPFLNVDQKGWAEAK